MGTTFEAMQKKWEERLVRLEERLQGSGARVSADRERPADTHPAAHQWQHIAEEHASEKKSLMARIQVQKREIDSMKERLEESARRTAALQEEFRQQQVNVARLVDDWEKRLRVRQQEQTGEREQEAAFLKAEIEAQARQIEALVRQQREHEQAALAKDQEIVRLFERIETLEDENMALIKKAGQYQLALRAAAARSVQLPRRQKESRPFFRWLSKPVFVVRTGNEITN